MTDARTIGVYNARAGDYAERFAGPPSESLIAFEATLPRQADVLDLGCGPGTASGWLAEQGHRPTALDASSEMVGRAAAHPGVTARQASFDDVAEVAAYDGIWANFCLLHAPRADFPRHLDALTDALKSGGILHLGLKLGDGEDTDAMGRFYSYYSEAELTDHLNARDYTLLWSHTGEEAGLAGTVDPFILIRARKNG